MIAFWDSEMYLNWIEKDLNWLVTETTFESFWDEIETIKAEVDINKNKINKIDWRRLSIIKIVNSKSFNKMDCTWSSKINNSRRSTIFNFSEKGSIFMSGTWIFLPVTENFLVY